MKYFVLSLHFQVIYIFCLEVHFCRLHICRSCILIHSVTVCLLTGAFNPFTFKFIIDRYLFIAIFFLCTCGSPPPPFCSSYSSPFNISCNAHLVKMYSSRPFFVAGMVAGPCFSLFGIFYASPIWFIVFLLRNQLIALVELPCMLLGDSPLLPLIFSLCL